MMRERGAVDAFAAKFILSGFMSREAGTSANFAATLLQPADRVLCTRHLRGDLLNAFEATGGEPRRGC